MKQLIILIGLILNSGWASAQKISDVFTLMPDKMMLPVDSIQRLDLMDLYHAGRSAWVVNSFGDTTFVKELSEAHIVLKSGNLKVEVALLPMVNESKVVCLIKTVCAPVCDSRLEFYTTDWKLLDSNIFITPVEAEWFIRDDVNRDDEYFLTFKNALDMSLMEYHLDPQLLILLQTYNTPQYLSLETRRKVATYLKSEPKTFRWNSVRFE